MTATVIPFSQAKRKPPAVFIEKPKVEQQRDKSELFLLHPSVWDRTWLFVPDTKRIGGCTWKGGFHLESDSVRAEGTFVVEPLPAEPPHLYRWRFEISARGKGVKVDLTIEPTLKAQRNGCFLLSLDKKTEDAIYAAQLAERERVIQLQRERRLQRELARFAEWQRSGGAA